jgi:outer membrane protein, multidrug efflux system
MNYRALISLTLSLSLVSGLSAPAFASGTPKKPAPVVLTPETLRTDLVKSNSSILIALNQVYQSKDQVNIARGNLLPRLNLGTLIGIATGGPAFSLGAITMLLPFLVPSNWANLHQSENLLQSEKLSYKLMQLNTYATAYTLLATIQGDIALRGVVWQQYQDLVSIHDWLVNQRKYTGAVPQEDIDNADAQAKLSFANVSAMDELLDKERASIREMLALPLNADIQIQSAAVPASPFEGQPLAKAVAKVQAVAPENLQIAYMIKAGQDVQWSKVFSFIGDSSTTVSPSSKNPFGNLGVGTNFSIGFDYFPNIQLAADNIAQLQLQATQLKQQEQQLVEATLNSISEAQKQADAAAQAETELLSVYQAEFQKYTLGLTDLLHVFSAQQNVSTASAAKVKAQIDLDSLRVTMQRELIANEFAKLPGCAIKESAEQKDQDWLSHLFNPGGEDLSMDDTCQPDKT